MGNPDLYKWFLEIQLEIRKRIQKLKAIRVHLTIKIIKISFYNTPRIFGEQIESLFLL